MIKRVQILAFNLSAHEALAVESHLIDTYEGDLRNKWNSTDGHLVSTECADRLKSYEEPDDPNEVLEMLERLEDEADKLKLLRKKMKQLEGRYIKTYFEYENMKENIRNLDDIIEKSIYENI